MSNEKRLEQAIKVLNTNWKDGFTIPCEGLYPFQWNWDSGFIAIGLAHIAIEKAKQEVKSLLLGQWENGFLPHIIFHNESSSYFPGPEVHASTLNAFAPSIPTSGITQPPVLGFALEAIYDISNGSELEFVQSVYDKVYKVQEYFYTNRDPKNEGLVYICHNWESGTDNTPVWDLIWDNLDSPEYELNRRDTQHVDAENRPSNREYHHYIHLIELFKKWKYDDGLIAEKCPFLIQDPLFNSMLIKSSESLIRLGKILGRNKEVAQLEQWNEKAIAQFNAKLYDKEKAAYVYYDLRNERIVDFVSSSSFAALFSGIPTKEIADEIVKKNFKKGIFSGVEDEFLLCASFNPKSEDFDPKRYWRGPVWVNLNWILYRGLQRYGHNDIAQKVRNDTLFLLEKFGFYEYFDPRKQVVANLDQGYGGNNFSWSAALYIDFINRE